MFMCILVYIVNKNQPVSLFFSSSPPPFEKNTEAAEPLRLKKLFDQLEMCCNLS